VRRVHAGATPLDPELVAAVLARAETGEEIRRVREGNGYEIAEPNFSGGGPVFEKAESESAAFKKESAKCESLLGGPGPRRNEAERRKGRPPAAPFSVLLDSRSTCPRVFRTVLRSLRRPGRLRRFFRCCWR
jgi:hypothetical protein